MKKKLLSILAAVVTTLSLQAQVIDNIYDAGADDYANQTRVDGVTGDLYSVGSTTYIGAVGFDASLMKFNSAGVLQWLKSYGGAGNEFGRSFVRTPTGGLVIAGSTNSTGGPANTNISLIGADSDGNWVWSNVYGGDSADAATW